MGEFIKGISKLNEPQVKSPSVEDGFKIISEGFGRPNTSTTQQEVELPSITGGLVLPLVEQRLEEGKEVRFFSKGGEVLTLTDSALKTNPRTD